MKLYLTRHGQTEWNLAGRMQGRLNSNLTALGKQQATWLGERLKDESIDVICSSSSGRAIETAELIRSERNIDMVLMDELREIDLGHWQGMLIDDVIATHPEDSHAYWYQPESFVAKKQESFDEIIKRAGNALKMIIEKHEGQNVLVVSHGVFLKALFAHIENKSISQFWEGPFMHSTALSILKYDQNGFEICLQGDTTHYK